MMLRAIEEEDLEKLKSFRNDYGIYRWCRQYKPLNSYDQKKWFEKINADPSIEMFAIQHRGELIGACGLTSIDYVNSRAEFSLYISSEFQGLGLAKEALNDLLAFGFYDLNLNRIWGETFDENPALKMFESLGMEIEGTRKEFYYRSGRYIDAHLVSIGKEKWQKY